MAYQHFYSRVPARVSMYNKADGFDTFAHSAELDREFITREIYTVCENKLSKTDLDKARLGEIPTVYSATAVRGGAFVQTAITYIPRDYTGERSAYLAHSLVIEERERDALFASADNSPFSKDMFVVDISQFDITSESSAPRSDYESAPYVTAPLQSAAYIAEKYDTEILKRFIYAVLAVLAGKGKQVYFHLPYPDAEISDEALKFINAISSVIPYSLRTEMSYVTYVGNVAAYPNFKIKCTSGEFLEVPQSKGVFFDFESGLFTGVPELEITKNKNLINFFTALLTRDDMRREFLEFTEGATAFLGGKQLNMKTLTELVFLFTKCAPSAKEFAEISSDDELLEFFAVYEKYREALPTHYRTTAYTPLAKYPERHIPIPKTVFAKLSRLYGGEGVCAKRVAMDSVLNLMHTDLMRDKLFAFIKSNYADETAEMKAIICDDLCRVFYGGFLQSQILEFFSQNFEAEPDKTRDAVIEKLLLTVRTESIQRKILEFLNLHYDAMTDTAKSAFYKTYFEMLPECDKLAASLTALVNSHAHKENPEWKRALEGKLTALLSRDFADGERKLLRVLVDAEGFSQDAVLKLIFCTQSASPMYDEFMTVAKEKGAVDRAKILVRVSVLCKDVNPTAYEALLRELRPSFDSHNLYELISVDGVCVKGMSDKALQKVRNTIIYPAVSNKMLDAFDLKYKGGVDELWTFVMDKNALKSGFNYQTIENYRELISHASSEDAHGVGVALKRLPTDGTLRAEIGEYIRRRVLRKEADTNTTSLLLTLSSDFLCGEMRIEEIYSDYKKRFVQAYNIEYGAKANPTKAAKDGAQRSFELIICALSAISAVCPAYEYALCRDASGLEKTLSTFADDFGSASSKTILASLDGSSEGLRSFVNEKMNGAKKSPFGILAKMFSKK